MLPKLFAIVICLALPAFAVKQRVESVTTDHADFAPGGLIHVEGSTGELNIAGWDQPSVEIIATRYTFEEDRKKEKGVEEEKRVEVVKMVSGNGEMTISTMRKQERGIHVDYQIMVPRNSRLAIHHHIGDVVVTGVDGDIDATNGAGDIVVQLPEPEHYLIDAKSRLGTIYSDFNSPSHHKLVGETLNQDSAAADAKAPSRHINLRVGAGGISIQKLIAAQGQVPTAAGL
jgi:DUF4097 and DUF4098 domain-containing protein YvlB